MSETLLLVAGCLVFAMVTVATLLYGYMVFNRAWQVDNVASVRGPVGAPLAVPATIPASD